MTRTHAFNLTGAARKPLIEAIEGFAKVKGVYQGAPKFGYVFYGIGVLDKAGTLEFSPDCDAQVIMNLVTWLEQCGFACTIEGDVAEPEAPAEELAPETRHYQAELSDPDSPDRMEIFSAEDDTDAVRQAREFCTGEVVLLELLALDENYNVTRGVDLAPDRLVIQVPSEGFTPEKLDNLCKLVAAKEPLLKAALGVDSLPIQHKAETIDFPWFPADPPENAMPYAQLVTAICRTAMEKQRVLAKPIENHPNMRFAMRTFLISLGLVGPEFKAIRHLLCASLDGNSAFSRGYDPRKVAARAAEGGADDE